MRRDRARVAPEHGDQLVVHDFHERLARIQAARDFLAERAIAHAIDERFATGSATSASSNAMRIVRTVSRTLSSVIRPRPVTRCKAAVRRAVSLIEHE